MRHSTNRCETCLQNPEGCSPTNKATRWWSQIWDRPIKRPDGGPKFGTDRKIDQRWSQIWDRPIKRPDGGPKFGTAIWSISRSVPNLGPPSGRFCWSVPNLGPPSGRNLFGRSQIWDRHLVALFGMTKVLIRKGSTSFLNVLIGTTIWSLYGSVPNLGPPSGQRSLSYHVYWSVPNLGPPSGRFLGRSQIWDRHLGRFMGRSQNSGPPSGRFIGRSQIWDRHLVNFSVGPKFGTTIWSLSPVGPKFGTAIWSLYWSVPNLGPPSGRFMGRSQNWDHHLVALWVGPKFGTAIWSLYGSVPNLGPPSGQFFGRSQIWDHHLVALSVGPKFGTAIWSLCWSVPNLGPPSGPFFGGSQVWDEELRGHHWSPFGRHLFRPLFRGFEPQRDLLDRFSGVLCSSRPCPGPQCGLERGSADFRLMRTLLWGPPFILRLTVAFPT